METSSAALTRRRGGRPKAQRPSKSTPGRRPPTQRICSFCSDDATGKVMHEQRACDWSDGPYPLECTNCADYRALHPVAAAQHVCQVPRKALLYRKYSEHHPPRYEHAPSPVTGLPVGDASTCCVKCAADGRMAACDVDPILGYQCSRCKAVDNCHLADGRLMDNKPNLRQGVHRWFRHACDGCAQLTAGRRIGGTAQCSWLADHTTWREPCDRCHANNLVCLASGMIASMPEAISMPENWRPRSFIAFGWAELRPSTVWRKACLSCRRDSNHCRASIATPYSACGRCTAMGLDCVDHEGTVYPIFDLSQVGFGSFLPFTACRRCVETGRNCDRQRPCDSCTHAGEPHLCENAFLTTAAGKKRMANCLHGRLHPRPGPLYYLAHGYGANGVDDVKDGSRMEHWIGPVAEAYVMPSISFHEGSLIREISRQREALIPRSTPPHAAPGTPLASKSASQLTADDIAAMINEVWSDSFLMNTLDNFAEEQEHATLKKAMFGFDTPAGTDNPPTAADIAAAVGENPNFVSREIVRVIQALPVVAMLSEEDMDEDDEESEEQEDSAESEDRAAPQLGQGGQGDDTGNASVLPPPAGLTVQQTMQAAGAVARSGQPTEGTAADAADDEGATDTGAQEVAQTHIDPALLIRDPVSGEPDHPSVPFRHPSSILPQDNTLLGHTTTLPAHLVPAPEMSTPDADSDSPDPSLQSFSDSGQVPASWPLAPTDAVGPPVQQAPVHNPLQATPAHSAEPEAPAGPPIMTSVGPHGAVTRWEHRNPLHEFTRERLGFRDNTRSILLRQPFTTHLVIDNPVIDVLHSLPEPGPRDPSTASGYLRCVECHIDIDQISDFHCSAAVRLSDVCQDVHHQQASSHSHVCNACAQHSTQLLVDPRYAPLTAAEVLAMRSYLCDNCTTRAGVSIEGMLGMCTSGVNTVYGSFPSFLSSSMLPQATMLADENAPLFLAAPDGRGFVAFFNRARPLTGCACGVKLFQTRQCQFHRIENAKAVLSHAATVRDWRMRAGQHDRCAGCFEYPAEVTLQREQQEAATGLMPSPVQLHSWVCLACGAWVMNQASSELVDGWQSWFNPLPASLSGVGPHDADESPLGASGLSPF
ncbi:Zn(2)-C6 fungal-type DNA-binding domain protein [Cordyceps fumosorosea ARSEF 2679]|uniref:Zn(2)-C6 fungal-type DNA-binding domain protein n=1 Tax=Cordyceps fumosorosea (strain ARSEF 2679) TaxID=1081104 RepID=A0A167WP87_CORFA|nr:Zn(2)-C6 fungal-type DNA-binding domain protein [Cordyceps fumosorosea ARSEF 2679]OAA64039.1 Zn(2)-C6 fungal-type DNA-binding domain protein [Cordyceps fumosorosea ARSEF 2679]